MRISVRKDAENIIQLEKGSTATSYAPYSNICPISGRTETSVKSVGKNWFNPNGSTYTSGPYRFFNSFLKRTGNYIVSFTDKDTSVDLTGVNFGWVSNTSNVNAGYRWCISNGTIQSNTVNTSALDQSVLCYDLMVNPNTEETLNKLLQRYNIQIEMGTTATAYEPYKSSSATLTFGTTVYGGQVDFKTGRVRVDRQYQSVTLDSIYVRSGNVNCDYAIFVIDNAWGNFTEIENSFISDMMRWTTSGENFDNISKSGVALVYSTGTKQLAVSVPKGYTIEQARALFANAHVCLALGSPIELTLTPSMLKLLEGYNYITGDGEMSMVYIPESVLGMPTPPTADGNYKLRCTVTNGQPSFSWVSDT